MTFLTPVTISPFAHSQTFVKEEKNKTRPRSQKLENARRKPVTGAETSESVEPVCHHGYANRRKDNRWATRFLAFNDARRGIRDKYSTCKGGESENVCVRVRMLLVTDPYSTVLVTMTGVAASEMRAG
jgi:hypothetical protein